jgi:hypothetical protein
VITVTLSTHYSRVPLTSSLVIQLSVLSALVHNSLRLYSRIHADKSTWALQAITELWIMHWTCVKWCLLIDWSTGSIDYTLSCINVTCAILNQHTPSTSYVILFSSFSIGRLCTVDIYIILWVLNILKSVLILVVVHYWMICWLRSSSWFTWFLWGTSRLCGRIRSRIVDNETRFSGKTLI